MSDGSGTGKQEVAPGAVFGRWTVISRHDVDSGGRARWLCVCCCQMRTERVVMARNLRSGQSTSCGCHTYEKRCAALRARRRELKQIENDRADAIALLTDCRRVVPETMRVVITTFLKRVGAIP